MSARPYPRLTRARRWQIRRIFLFGLVYPDAMYHAIWGRNEAKKDAPWSASLGWHVISGEHLLESLQRAAAGEDPDLVYAELWANAEHERPDEDAA